MFNGDISVVDSVWRRLKLKDDSEWRECKTVKRGTDSNENLSKREEKRSGSEKGRERERKVEFIRHFLCKQQGHFKTKLEMYVLGMLHNSISRPEYTF